MKKNYKKWLVFLLLGVSLNCYASISHLLVKTEENTPDVFGSTKSAETMQQKADDLIQEKLDSLSSGSSIKIDHIHYTILKYSEKDGEHIRKIIATVWYEKS